MTLVVMATNAGVFTNTATVTSASFDPNMTNNSASVVTTVNMVSPPQADLHLAKWASSAGVYVGEPLTYTLVVTNSGPDVASQVWLTDSLPLALTFASSTMDCGGTSVVTCTLATLAPNEVATVTLVVTGSVSGVFTNTATVSAVEMDSDLTNNSAQVSTVLRCADIAAGPGVTIADIQTVAGAWGQTDQDAGWSLLWDFVPDGQIDTADLVFVAERWQSTCPQ